MTKLSAVADAYLLARRQITLNIVASITKFGLLVYLSPVSAAAAIVVAPIEGTIDAVQTRILMRKILEENHINCSHLDKVNFFKMGLGSWVIRSETTPMRNGQGRVAIPKNTKKTRGHLNKLLPDNESLKTILNDRNNFRMLDHSDRTNGGVMKEEAWRKILGLIIEADNSSEPG